MGEDVYKVPTETGTSSAWKEANRLIIGVKLTSGAALAATDFLPCPRGIRRILVTPAGKSPAGVIAQAPFHRSPMTIILSNVQHLAEIEDATRRIGDRRSIYGNSE